MVNQWDDTRDSIDDFPSLRTRVERTSNEVLFPLRKLMKALAEVLFVVDKISRIYRVSHMKLTAQFFNVRFCSARK